MVLAENKATKQPNQEQLVKSIVEKNIDDLMFAIFPKNNVDILHKQWLGIMQNNDDLVIYVHPATGRISSTEKRIPIRLKVERTGEYYEWDTFLRKYIKYSGEGYKLNFLNQQDQVSATATAVLNSTINLFNRRFSLKRPESSLTH